MTEIKLDWKRLKFWPESGKIYFTYTDIAKFPEWPDGPLVEIIEGELYMVPSPAINHQKISKNIEKILTNYVDRKKLGTLWHAPVDVVLSEENVVIPDIFFISSEKTHIIQKKNIQGVPDLIIEILSENRQRDLEYKKQLYETFKVPEYWIVDPENLTVSVFILNKNRNKYGKAQLLSQEDVIVGKIFPDFKIRVAEIFEDK